jgi:hypothetical protein
MNSRQPRVSQRRARSLESRRRAQIRELCRQAALIEDPFVLEQWTSSLLGHAWQRRGWVAPEQRVDAMIALGRPVLESFFDVGSVGAKTALLGVAGIETGALGRLASALADSLPDVSVPGWIDEVGRAGIVRVIADCSPGDGEALFLEADPAACHPHMVAVFIADRLGGMAKHLALTQVIDTDPPERGDEEHDFRYGLRPVDPVLACRRVRLAIELTDVDPEAPVGETFADCRALAIARTTRRLARA